MFLCHPLGAKGGAKEDVEEQGGVELGLSRQLIVSLRYNELLAKTTHILNSLHVYFICI